jgi:DNA-binding winged helix-turn-helix (wHTH) protein
MQTREFKRTQVAEALRADAYRIAPRPCGLVNEHGLIDLQQEQCQTVQALLQELQAYREARPDTAWRLDRLGRAVITEGKRVEFTRTQFSIVEVLARAGGEFLNVYDILMGVWGFAQPIGGGELVRTHIRAIRRRLRGCRVSDDFINGSRGRGYRINPKFAQPYAEDSRQMSTAARAYRPTT